MEISVIANLDVRTTENDSNFTWKFYFSILSSLLQYLESIPEPNSVHFSIPG